MSDKVNPTDQFQEALLKAQQLEKRCNKPYDLLSQTLQDVKAGNSSDPAFVSEIIKMILEAPPDATEQHVQRIYG